MFIDRTAVKVLRCSMLGNFLMESGGYWKCYGYKTPPDRKSDVTVGGLLFVWANTYLGL